jgi:hypothetical protein
MPGPNQRPLALTADAHHALAALDRHHTAPQPRVPRARRILLAADGLHHRQNGRMLSLEAATVRRWRQRWCGFAGRALADLSGEARLSDAPRPGCLPRGTPEQVGRIVALDCEAPSAAGRPISHRRCGARRV